MFRVIKTTFLSLAALLGAVRSYSADPSAGIFSTPLTAENLDASAFTEWVDGAESQMRLKDGPRHVLWTRNSKIEWDGASFGETKSAGPRHLRIGWNTPIAVGSVLLRGNVSVSFLKADASYPGKLSEDGDWLPAQRLKGTEAVREEAGREDYGLWVLPPGTVTRAVRFTHTSAFADAKYAGWLGGACVMSERFANVAPQAIVSASAANEKASKLNNESNDGTWGAWDNGKEGHAEALSSTHPEWILLTWPAPVPLRGLNALWAGFGAAEIQTYHGPAEKHPREASAADWETIGQFTKVSNGYPVQLWPNWVDFGQTIRTRALRLRFTATTTEQHGHLKGNTKSGKRIWLGEIQALQALGTEELRSAILAQPSLEKLHAPIPIEFTLPEEGFVTLVLDDATGKRVRNLVAETKFPAGKNTVWWDGMDDTLRDAEAARHGLYHIPSQFVAPGSYRVTGLWRKAIDLHYEFSVYNAGNPAWETADHTGAWLANHTPPQSALFVPGNRAVGGKPLVFLGSYVSEGGHGLAWVDLDGRKQGGVGWVGGVWTGAPFLARDDGPNHATNVMAFAAAAWSDDAASKKTKAKVGEIRLTALAMDGHKPILKHPFTPPSAEGGKIEWSDHIGGLAARDNLLVVSLPTLNQLLFADARAKSVVGTANLEKPRGLAFDAHGSLYALSDRKLLRYEAGKLDFAKAQLPEPRVLVDGLEAPRALAFDLAGNLYISDRGSSHQVKVFSQAGTFLRAIGRPGAPKAGPYNELHMNNPDGLSIDSLSRLWVAENDYQPKRVSVWTLEGKFVRAFYGPSEYGGGGKLDPQDKTKFYFHGMEFQLDWESGKDRLAQVFNRPGPGELKLPDGYGANGVPEQPHYVRGRKYFSNDHNSNPTGGPGIAMVWQEVDGIARPAAAFGRAQDWKILKTDSFAARWPKGTKSQGVCFAWSDLNGDAQMQTNEVQFLPGAVGSVTVAPDLSFVASRLGSNAMRFAPTSFTKSGAPVYDLNAGEKLASGVQGPASSGGDQALWHSNGWTILTTPAKPWSQMSVGGVYRGEARWTYPSLWPGLHASHEAPPPDRPGELIGTTRLLGDFITPSQGDAGPLWCINGNMGNMYLLTADGLFVAELFRDVRRGTSWGMPVAQRGMLINNLSLHDENFWPSIAQTRDGAVYLVDGGRSSLVRVDGLETIRRWPERILDVSTADLQQARAYFVEAESQRQQSQGRGVLKVALREDAPRVDGQLEDWARAEWVDIDKSGVAANFDSNSKPYDVRAALAVSGDRLYAAYRTGDANLLRNSGEMANALFKTGGALDLMVGADARADLKRSTPMAGDSRLLVTRVKNQTLALLYRAVVPGAKDPVSFSSPWRTITLDRVQDVSSQVQFAGTNGNFEISIPLATLGLKPAPGQTIRGDIGILRGNGFQTLQRVYWCNKATGIVADVPSEAELTPRLWGMLEF